MSLLETLLYGKSYSVCAFCKSKVNRTDAVFSDGCVCICRECNSKIKVAPFDFTYKGTKHISYVISPLYYKDLIRDAILNLKFSNDNGIAEALGYYINNYLTTFDGLFDDFDCLVPVPLSKIHYNRRGYNQAELIARQIEKVYKIPANTEILKKIKDTPPQSSLSHDKRAKNAENVYAADSSVKDMRIMLVDDVFTTGSTLESCAKELKDKGAAFTAAITVTYGTKPQHSKNYYELFP